MLYQLKFSTVGPSLKRVAIFDPQFIFSEFLGGRRKSSRLSRVSTSKFSPSARLSSSQLAIYGKTLMNSLSLLLSLFRGGVCLGPLFPEEHSADRLDDSHVNFGREQRTLCAWIVCENFEKSLSSSRVALSHDRILNGFSYSDAGLVTSMERTKPNNLRAAIVVSGLILLNLSEGLFAET